MKVAVYQPASVPRSMSITTRCVTDELEMLGVELLWFEDRLAVPADAELVWDPWVGGGYLSEVNREHTAKPIVITVAGAALFSVALRETKLGLRGKLGVLKERFRLRRLWRKHAGDYARVLTISDYARSELLAHLPLLPERVKVVALGKDAELAQLEDPALAKDLAAPYLLHLSFFQPKKNIDRLIEAYLKIADQSEVPPLLVVSTEYPGTCPHPKVRIVAEDVTRSQIATYYRHASGFVFPSLHETFAMPLTEAMLFGLPLITANTTACPETAGDAALLVDPLDTDAIASAMLRLATDTALHADLCARSLKRGEQFTWRKTAEAYLETFAEVLEES